MEAVDLTIVKTKMGSSVLKSIDLTNVKTKMGSSVLISVILTNVKTKMGSSVIKSVDLTICHYKDGIFGAQRNCILLKKGKKVFLCKAITFQLYILGFQHTMAHNFNTVQYMKT